MLHPYSYLAIQQLEEDRRRDLQQGIRAAQARTLARPRLRARPRGLGAWRGVASTARRLVSQPAA